MSAIGGSACNAISLLLVIPHSPGISRLDTQDSRFRGNDRVDLGRGLSPASAGRKPGIPLESFLLALFYSESSLGLVGRTFIAMVEMALRLGQGHISKEIGNCSRAVFLG